MKKLKLYFLFYKTKFLFPLTFAILTLVFTNIMLIAVITLLMATLLIWFYQGYVNDRKKVALYLYYNLGISTLKLYVFLFFINLIVLTGTNICIK
ncbi:MAG: hypothetical protein ACJAYY_000769 [Paraglaciecola sp.]|jgi:hypothetical protein